MKKIINFVKKNYFISLSILFVFFGFVFVITGISLSYPYFNLEQEYQVAYYGFYDSTKTYLLDVKNTLSNYSVFTAVGLACAFISAVFLVFGFSDYYMKGKKHEKENN